MVLEGLRHVRDGFIQGSYHARKGLALGGKVGVGSYKRGWRLDRTMHRLDRGMAVSVCCVHASMLAHLERQVHEQGLVGIVLSHYLLRSLYI